MYPSHTRHTMWFLNHTDGPLFPPLLSPLPLTTPPHHSPSPLRSYSPLLTPFPIITSLHSPHPYSHQCSPPFTPLLLTTSSHHSPNYSLSLLVPTRASALGLCFLWGRRKHRPSALARVGTISLPLTTLTTPPHLPSSPHLLTTLFTTLFLTYLPNHTPLHHPLHPSPHHS